MSRLSFSKELGHSFALVGYDDSLYADHGYKIKGGFILKGTWDDVSYQYTSLPYQTVLDLVALNESRARTFYKNIREGHNKTENGDSVFMFKLGILNLPQGFEDEVYQQYQKYVDQSEYQLFYYPHILNLGVARNQVKSFDRELGHYDFASLSSQEENYARNFLVSILFRDVSSAIGVGVFSGWAKSLEAISNNTISQYYKFSREQDLFPDIYDIISLNEAGDYDYSFLSRDPNDLQFWKGLFYSAKLMLKKHNIWEEKGEKYEI
jgi:hypothetical protein